MGLIGDLTGHKSNLEGPSLSRLCRLSQVSPRAQWICPVTECLSSPKRLELWGRGDVRDADWRPQSCGPFEEHPVAPAQVGLLWLGTELTELLPGTVLSAAPFSFLSPGTKEV